jgi:hypothetical protein
MYLLDEIFTNTVRSTGKSFTTCSCTSCTFIPNNDNVMLYNGVTCDPRLKDQILDADDYLYLIESKTIVFL